MYAICQFSQAQSQLASWQPHDNTNNKTKGSCCSQPRDKEDNCYGCAASSGSLNDMSKLTFSDQELPLISFKLLYL